MSPDEKDPKDAPGASADEVGRGDERSEAVEATGEKPKPKRKPAAKNTQKTSSSGTGKPAASAAEVEKKQVSEEAAKSIPRADDEDETPAPDEEPKAEDETASGAGKPATPVRKRDQPRKREPGEAPVLVSAKARYVRTSARKARLVCDHIRGKDVEQARAILSFTPRGAAKPWMKLLESAIANAEHNHELVGDELKIASVHADEGPTLKRYRPRAMGRATRIRKRTSHLSITLTPKE
jgi:ribosomal protein L22